MLDPYLTPDTEINSEWIMGLNLRAKTINSQEKNMRVNLGDFGLGSGFLHIYTMPKAQAMGEKIDTLDFIKIENICIAKDTRK